MSYKAAQYTQIGSVYIQILHVPDMFSLSGIHKLNKMISENYI